MHRRQLLVGKRSALHHAASLKIPSALLGIAVILRWIIRRAPQDDFNQLRLTHVRSSSSQRQPLYPLSRHTHGLGACLGSFSYLNQHGMDPRAQPKMKM